MASLVAPIRASFQRRWKRWLNQRIKPVSSITLDQKRIFIFPTGAGLLFGIMLFVMLLTAINYQNNSIYLLVFFLAGLFVLFGECSIDSSLCAVIRILLAEHVVG